MRALLLAFVVACNGSSSPSGSPAPSDDGGGGAPPPGDDASSDAGPMPIDCGDATLAPLRSCNVAAWPPSMPVVATDVTASSAPTTTPIAGKPAGLDITADGGWLFAAGSSLSVYKRAGATLTHDHDIALPAGTPFALRLSHDGKTLAVSVGGTLALFDTAKAEANAPDALLGTVSTRSAHNTTIDAVFTMDDRFVLATLEYDGVVAVVDATSRTYVGAVPIAGDALTGLAIAPDGARIYVVAEVSNEWKTRNPKGPSATDQNVGSLTVVDAAKATQDPAHAEIGHVFAGRGPVRVALSPDGGTAWVTSRGGDQVLGIDTTKMFSDPDHGLVATIPVGPAPVGLAMIDSGAAILVANSNRFLAPTANQTAMVVSVAKRAVVGQIGVGAFPRDVVADGASAFLSNYDSSTLSGFDVAKLPAP